MKSLEGNMSTVQSSRKKVASVLLKKIDRLPIGGVRIRFRFGGLFLSALLWAAQPMTAQTAPGAPVSAPVPPPLPHLYKYFMEHQYHLDERASALEQQGKSGAWLRNYYQQKLSFSDAQMQTVRDTAQRLHGELKQINDQVQAIVAADRTAHPHLLASPQDLPPPIPALADLSKQHETVMQKEMANLRQAMGPDQSAKLDTFLQKDFAPHVTMRLVAPPQKPAPSKQSVPAFPSTGVQP